MSHTENPSQKVEATTDKVDVSQNPEDFEQDREVSKKHPKKEATAALAQLEKEFRGGKKNGNEFIRSHISDKFVELQLAPKGKEQLMKVMEKIAREHAQEAYAQNMNLIKSEINAYIYGNNGKISKAELVRWCQEFNNKIRKMGADSDVIDSDKILKLEHKIINSGSGADPDAW